MFDGKQFLEDYGINYETRGKNISPGWIGLRCPRCSDPSEHLGFNPIKGYFSCWRCGFMPLIEAIHRLTGMPWKDARHIASKYGGSRAKRIRYEKTDKENPEITVTFPFGTLDELTKRHRKYLEDRNFDPDYLQKVWDIKGTKKVGDYSNRILAPIYHNNILVSYQGRDITNRSSMRYKACNTTKERRHHKYCLYGLDNSIGDSVLVVEGITDAWRMGVGSVATFGTSYTETQVNLLQQHFNTIHIMFDETDPQAQKKAKALALKLCSLGRDAGVIKLGVDTDPGELSNKNARKIMQELMIC